ncbi:MAG: recombinase family protein [Xanthobacteraceae bacterium]|nr:recombinase family protein [Xanthobacteraceae bacterium]
MSNYSREKTSVSVATYARFSSPGSDGPSLERQVELCAEVARRFGSKADRAYVDKGLNGAKAGAPGLLDGSRDRRGGPGRRSR